MKLDFNKINVAQPMDLAAMYQSENLKLKNENIILRSQLNSNNNLLTTLFEEHPEIFSKNYLTGDDQDGNDRNEDDKS